jgi:glycosyltransferase involved in cell wall biosynthesis
MLTNPEFSLIIPCFNEEIALNLLIPELNELNSQVENLQVILVDNGSNDGTRKILEKFVAQNLNALLVVVPTNLGYGNGILKGIEVANSEVIIWTHSDMQCDLMDVKTAIELWSTLGDHDSLIIKGKRNNRSIMDRSIAIGMSSVNFLINRVYISDVNGQPNMLAKKTLLSLDKIPLDSTFELYILTLLNSKFKARIHNFQVLFDERIGGIGANQKMVAKVKYMLKCVKQSIAIRGLIHDN